MPAVQYARIHMLFGKKSILRNLDLCMIEECQILVSNMQLLDQLVQLIKFGVDVTTIFSSSFWYEIQISSSSNKEGFNTSPLYLSYAQSY